MDIDGNVLPQVSIACFVFHNYCEMKKAKEPEQNILSSLNQKRGRSYLQSYWATKRL